MDHFVKPISTGFDSPEIHNLAVADSKLYGPNSLVECIFTLANYEDSRNRDYSFDPLTRNAIWLSSLERKDLDISIIPEAGTPQNVQIIGNKTAYDAGNICFIPGLPEISLQHSDIVLSEISLNTILTFQETVERLVENVKMRFGHLNFHQLESLVQSLVASIEVIIGETTYNETIYDFPYTAVSNEEP